ncbi:MAG: type 4a pilus biogenesis protein PilO [Solirubrobacterales bacterium]
MKRGSNRLVVAMLVLVVAAGAFWMLLISPKRDEANKLEAKVQRLETQLAQHRSEAETAETARQEFPTNYSQLVVLGKAVPADSETSSLLVQVQHIAEKSQVRFEEISLNAKTEESAATSVSEGSTEAGSTELASPTEVAASTKPLGASIGPAGLSVMPYTLNFTGDFLHIAKFIHGLDNLVKTTNSKVSVDGRLITVNSFKLAAGEEGFPELKATFSMTTYLTPPEQGLTGGATPSGPAPTATATPTAATIGGTP